MQVGHCLRLPRRVLRSYNTLGIAFGVCSLALGLLRARCGFSTLVGERKEGKKDSFDRSVAQSKRKVNLSKRSKRFERLTCIRSGDNKKVVFLRYCLMVALRICSLALGLLRAGGGEILYMPLTFDRTQVVRQSNVYRSREGNGSHWSSES